MLAETVSIDGGAILLFAIVLLLIAAVAVAIVVFGFVLAPRAGRGSRRALVWWVIVLVLEVLYALGSVAGIMSGDFTVLVLLPPAIIACQVAMFLQARKSVGR